MDAGWMYREAAHLMRSLLRLDPGEAVGQKGG